MKRKTKFNIAGFIMVFIAVAFLVTSFTIWGAARVLIGLVLGHYGCVCWEIADGGKWPK